MVLFGASQMTSATNIVSKLKVLFGFGVYHPVFFLSNSKSLIGVNMLRIGDNRPHVLQRTMESVIELYEVGRLDPVVGREYPMEGLADAHAYLESRKSIGKLVVRVRDVSK